MTAAAIAAILGQQGSGPVSLDSLDWAVMLWAEGAQTQALGKVDGEEFDGDLPNEGNRGGVLTDHGTGGAGIVYRASGIGGRPCFEFPLGESNRYARTNGHTLTPTITEPYSFLIVIEPAEIDRNNKHFFAVDSSRWILDDGGAGDGRLQLNDADTALGITDNYNALTTLDPYVIVGIVDGANSRLVYNGTTVVGETDTDSGAVLASDISLGTNKSGGGLGFKGQIALAALIEGDLTDPASIATGPDVIASALEHYGIEAWPIAKIAASGNVLFEETFTDRTTGRLDLVGGPPIVADPGTVWLTTVAATVYRPDGVKIRTNNNIAMMKADATQEDVRVTARWQMRSRSILEGTTTTREWVGMHVRCEGGPAGGSDDRLILTPVGNATDGPPLWGLDAHGAGGNLIDWDLTAFFAPDTPPEHDDWVTVVARIEGDIFTFESLAKNDDDPVTLDITYDLASNATAHAALGAGSGNTFVGFNDEQDDIADERETYITYIRVEDPS